MLTAVVHTLVVNCLLTKSGGDVKLVVMGVRATLHLSVCTSMQRTTNIWSLLWPELHWQNISEQVEPQGCGMQKPSVSGTCSGTHQSIRSDGLHSFKSKVKQCAQRLLAGKASTSDVWWRQISGFPLGHPFSLNYYT